MVQLEIATEMIVGAMAPVNRAETPDKYIGVLARENETL
jgi:hypothetical protein